MKKITLFIYFILACTIASHAQDEQDTLPPIVVDTTLAINSVYVEFFGIAGQGSINYDRIMFNKGNIELGGRIGLFMLNKSSFVITIPMGINCLIGRSEHHLEIGIGNTVLGEFASGQSTPITLFGTGTIGYRYQERTGGLFLKIAYTPLTEDYKFTNLEHWAGAAIGYTFKKKKK